MVLSIEKQKHNGPKDKNHMINAIDAKKVFDKIQYAFMLKVLDGTGLNGTYLNMIKLYIYNKHLS